MTMASSSSSLRFLLRPIQGSVVWGGTGLGAGIVVPKLLANVGWIYSTSLITTTACGGAIAILMPLGLARGIVSSLNLYLIEEGNITKVVENVSSSSSSSTQSSKLITTMENPKLMWETITFGSGKKGRMIRSIASPFLPSTSQMLMRMQQAVDTNPTDSNKVIASAASGLVEGFLQDRKDTITIGGLLVYTAVLGIGLGVDYSYRRVDEKKEAIKDSARQQKEAAEKMIQDKKQQFKDVTDKVNKVWKKKKKPSSSSDDHDDEENEKTPSFVNVAKETADSFVESNKQYIEDVADTAREKKDSVETKFQDMKQDMKDIVAEKMDKKQIDILDHEMDDSKTRMIQEIKNQQHKQLEEDSGTLEKAKTLAEDAVQESKIAGEKLFSKEKRQQWKDATSSWFKKKKNEMEEKKHGSTSGNDENNNDQ